MNFPIVFENHHKIVIKVLFSYIAVLVIPLKFKITAIGSRVWIAIRNKLLYKKKYNV